MDQNGGAGSGMDSTFDMAGLSNEDLQQMQLDPNMMNLDMSHMQDIGLDLSSNYNMMDTNGQHQGRQAQQRFSGQQSGQRADKNTFGPAPPSDLDGFQFDPSPMPSSMNANMSPAGFASPAVSAGAGRTPASIPNGGTIARRRFEKAQKAQRRASAGNLGLDTNFSSVDNAMSSQSPIYPMTASGVPMSLDSPYYGNASVVGMGMDFGMSQSGDMQNPLAMNMFSNQGVMQNMNHQLVSSMGQQRNQHGSGNGKPPSPTRRQSYPPQQPQPQMPQLQHRHTSASGSQTPKQHTSSDQNGALASNDGDIQKLAHMSVADPYNQSQLINQMQAVLAGRAPVRAMNHSSQNQSGFAHKQPPLQHNNRFMGYDTKQLQDMNSFTTGIMNMSGDDQYGSQQSIPQYLNAYSSTGFDMLSVLMRVATRPKPRINIGAVDLSCAFVVCDVSQHDLPIVYCSEMFERLTGYNKHEILGRNCRFLQAPDGRVESGIRRVYVDDKAVLHLKNMINQRQEAQISLINYRKGGQPFTNLLTMIPVSWETDEIRYYVGFQVDLVEQPTSITNKNPDGTYQVNYQRGWLPRYVPNPGTSGKQPDPDLDRSVSNDEVAKTLAGIGTTDSEVTKRLFDKVLLENSDDVVHVLSLKGLFLYLSPSCKRILEYGPHELVGTALSSVCHPSDIVPVTRELKETSNGTTVSIIFRIRRKYSGYTWFEAHGALHNEQGKSKKCIILVGRARPVYALLRHDIVKGFGESELWTKMSTAGMFLYVSQHVKSLLDRVPDDLIGSSAQSLMRTESKVEFGKALELARTGFKHTFKHDVQNKRGQTLHAETTLYPGDSTEGSKPTFLIGQTRLLKMGRAQPALMKQSSSQTDSSRTFMATSASPSLNLSMSAGNTSSRSDSTSRPTPQSLSGYGTPMNDPSAPQKSANGVLTAAGGHSLTLGSQDELLAADGNVFDELRTTRSTSWQFELRQMEKRNRLLAEELQSLLSSKKKRKRRKGMGQMQKDCANCHTRSTPEWRRGPSGNRDLCNSCGLRYAKQQGRVSPRTSSQHSGDKHSQASSPHASLGDRMPTAASPASPSARQSPAHQGGNGPSQLGRQSMDASDKDVKVEMPESITGNASAGPAAFAERTIPQTIQEGEEPEDDEL